MVKQDAMNVFLGCFQPTENGTPLWDLESDYNLHNQSLCPPPPLVNKVLFEKIYLDSHALAVPVIRQLIESSIKKALTEADKSRVALVPIDSKKKLKKVLQSDELVIRTEKIEDVLAYLRRLGVPDIQRARLLRAYFVRQAMALQRELEEAAAAMSPAGEDHDANMSGKSSRIHLKIAIRNIGRLEKRKFLRSVASKRIAGLAAEWWKTALLDFEEGLYGVSQQGEVTGVARFVPKPLQKPPSYFHRVYSPNVLSEFDTLLSLDFFTPVDAARDVAEAGVVMAPTRPTPTAVRVRPVGLSHGVAAAAAALARKFDREYLNGNLRPKLSYAVLHMHDEYPAAVASTSSIHLGSYHGPGEWTHPTATAGMRGAVPPGGKVTSSDSSLTESPDAVTANAGFQITRYMRKLVGGFLRKDDSTAAPSNAGKSAHKQRDGKREWNWYHHMIGFHEHRVSRKTSQLYARYVTVANNPLLLMEKMGNQRLAEEEYYLLLRDYNIDVDNVFGMEHLSIEGYVSSEVNQGMFQGMPQRESAIAAFAFLFTTLVQVEAELQADAAGLDGSAREPFAPNPSTKSGARRRSQTAHSSGAADHSGAAHHRSASDGNAGHQVQDPRLLVRLALQKNPALEMHIERCLHRVGNVRGLDQEFRRIVAEYLTQQASYGREMSYDHLSTRLSANTNEHSIIEYAMQFDHRALAQDLDNIEFLARCSPAYESFHELSNLRQTLAPVQAEVRDTKKEVLRALDAQIMTSPQVDAVVARSQDDASVQTSTTVTDSLGLSGHIPGLQLQEDLQKDYSLDMLGRPFPYVDNIGLVGVQNPPGQPQLFYQMDSDLYVRSTNPFMQLNEVAVNSLTHALYAF
jgi:hypothetical protein